MGGRAIQNEPTVLIVSDQALVILERAGWMQYLNKLQGFHEEMTLEFLQNLQNGSTTVRGRDIKVSEAIIAEVTRLLAKGTKWTDKHVLLHNAIVVLQDPDEQFVRIGRGFTLQR